MTYVTCRRDMTEILLRAVGKKKETFNQSTKIEGVDLPANKLEGATK